MLLDSYYRTQIDKLRQAAVVIMTGPFKSPGTELVRKGYGMPFDTLSLGSNPCINQKNSLEFCGTLLQEAASLSEEIETTLPIDYPGGIDFYVLNLMRK